METLCNAEGVEPVSGVSMGSVNNSKMVGALKASKTLLLLETLAILY